MSDKRRHLEGTLPDTVVFGRDIYPVDIWNFLHRAPEPFPFWNSINP